MYFECVCVCLCVPLCVFVMFKCVVSVSALIIYAYDDIHESGRSMLMTTCATVPHAHQYARLHNKIPYLSCPTQRQKKVLIVGTLGIGKLELTKQRFSSCIYSLLFRSLLQVSRILGTYFRPLDKETLVLSRGRVGRACIRWMKKGSIDGINWISR